MYSLETNLLIFYVAGGFLVLLAWAAVTGEMLLGANRPGIRRSVRLLAVLGVLHPAAAVASWDLVRLGTTTGDPALDFSPAWRRVTAAVVVSSAIVAVAFWAVAVVR